MFKVCPAYVHGHKSLRQRRHWLIAASMMDWSNCAHSILTKMQTKIYPLLLTFSVEFSSVEYVNNKLLIDHVAPSVKMMMHM